MSSPPPVASNIKVLGIFLDYQQTIISTKVVEINNLKEEVDRLETHIKFQPGGEAYFELEKKFNERVTKRK